MYTIYSFISSNIYLYICIVICLIILATILFIVSGNKKNRDKIKEDFVEAEKIEAEKESIDKGENNTMLEDIIQKMQSDIEVKPEDVVRKFEQEQEENAIISYQELLDNVKSNSSKVETIVEEPSNINFVEAISSDIGEPVTSVDTPNESSVTPEMVRQAIENISKDSIKNSSEEKKFKQSSFISPVYGILDDSKVEYPRVRKKETILDIMNTRDYNELTEEIKRQEEFLQALKEFRNNL